MVHYTQIRDYGLIAIAILIVIIAGTYATMFKTADTTKPALQSTMQSIQSVATSNASSIGQFKNQFCGLTSIPNSNNYVTEYRLPHTCEMPLGIAVDSQARKVWYVLHLAIII